MNDFTVHYTDRVGDSVKTLDMGGLSLEVTNFAYDSGMNAFQPGRTFYSEDLKFSKKNYSVSSKDSMYTFQVGKVTLSTRDKSLIIDSFRLVPNFPMYEFARRLGYQVDRTEVFVPRISLSGIDLEKLVKEKKVHAGLVMVDAPVMNDFKDKRIPIRKDVIKPLFQQQLRDLKFEITVDTAKVVDGRVVYSEQTGESPGMIFFEKMNVTATGITNDPYLVDKGISLEATRQRIFYGKSNGKGTV